MDDFYKNKITPNHPNIVKQTQHDTIRKSTTP